MACIRTLGIPKTNYATPPGFTFNWETKVSHQQHAHAHTHTNACRIHQRVRRWGTNDMSKQSVIRFLVFCMRADVRKLRHSGQSTLQYSSYLVVTNAWIWTSHPGISATTVIATGLWGKCLVLGHVHQTLTGGTRWDRPLMNHMPSFKTRGTATVGTT